MKLKKIFFAILCSLLTFFILSPVAAQTPGSAEDPLVTRSYVDRLIADLAGISVGGNLTQQQLDRIVNEVISRLDQSGQGQGSHFQHNTAGRYTPVQLLSGQILVGDEGTEIILRSGTAVAHTTGTDGLANITTGTDIRHGEEIGNNNMLIIPRDDGRGVMATSNAWLLVKGSYDIL
ncbi:MAG: hypothetical protein FWE24_08850 [Defluviitaleaceae bacterium]|nr:hypothetical protein [Defluviitaleaceae bacterium]